MLILHGKRVATIKKFTDHTQSCTNCKAFDLNVKVFRQYQHIYFIPLAPVGEKLADIKCNQCGETLRREALQKEYAKTAKTPIYFYSFIGVVCGLLALGIYWVNQEEKKIPVFVANPKVGDVYLIKQEEKESTSYYYLRLKSVHDDTVLVYHNNLVYEGYPSKFNIDDFFVKEEELYYTKKELKQMVEKGEINNVDRDYGDFEGFNRFK
jgi:hypothetical protein